jgi:serine/threonine protein kinase
MQAALDEFTAACLGGRPPDLDAFCKAHRDCGPQLRERVAEIRYVIEHGRAVAERQPVALPGEDHPESIGPYHIVELLGEGGMGTVYLAEQLAPVQRRVALKVIKLGMDSRAVLKRFELERQALAVMSHACIARVFDCGTTERGQPYFALEYVPGTPLVEYCDRHALSVEQRLRLFQRLCDGVQHAHQKGVIWQRARDRGAGQSCAEDHRLRAGAGNRADAAARDTVHRAPTHSRHAGVHVARAGGP